MRAFLLFGEFEPYPFIPMFKPIFLFNDRLPCFSIGYRVVIDFAEAFIQILFHKSRQTFGQCDGKQGFATAECLQPYALDAIGYRD